jgi:hypothetical protein
MKPVARPRFLVIIFLLRLAPVARAADCFLDCMQRSGCWSGQPVSDPAGCNNMPQLCTIQCKGQSNIWGAIAYSSRDMGAGYAQGKNDRASAEKEALSICAQRGRACVFQTAFNKQCGALADQRDATRKAVDDCKKADGARCVLHISFCSQ